MGDCRWRGAAPGLLSCVHKKSCSHRAVFGDGTAKEYPGTTSCRGNSSGSSKANREPQGGTRRHQQAGRRGRSGRRYGAGAGVGLSAWAAPGIHSISPAPKPLVIGAALLPKVAWRRGGTIFRMWKGHGYEERGISGHWRKQSSMEQRGVFWSFVAGLERADLSYWCSGKWTSILTPRQGFATLCANDCARAVRCLRRKSGA